MFFLHITLEWSVWHDPGSLSGRSCVYAGCWIGADQTVRCLPHSDGLARGLCIATAGQQLGDGCAHDPNAAAAAAQPA